MKKYIIQTIAVNGLSISMDKMDERIKFKYKYECFEH